MSSLHTTVSATMPNSSIFRLLGSQSNRPSGDILLSWSLRTCWTNICLPNAPVRNNPTTAAHQNPSHLLADWFYPSKTIDFVRRTANRCVIHSVHDWASPLPGRFRRAPPASFRNFSRTRIFNSAEDSPIGPDTARRKLPELTDDLKELFEDFPEFTENLISAHPDFHDSYEDTVKFLNSFEDELETDYVTGVNNVEDYLLSEDRPIPNAALAEADFFPALGTASLLFDSEVGLQVHRHERINLQEDLMNLPASFFTMIDDNEYWKFQNLPIDLNFDELDFSPHSPVYTINTDTAHDRRQSLANILMSTNTALTDVAWDLWNECVRDPEFRSRIYLKRYLLYDLLRRNVQPLYWQRIQQIVDSIPDSQRTFIDFQYDLWASMRLNKSESIFPLFRHMSEIFPHQLARIWESIKYYYSRLYLPKEYLKCWAVFNASKPDKNSRFPFAQTDLNSIVLSIIARTREKLVKSTAQRDDHSSRPVQVMMQHIAGRVSDRKLTSALYSIFSDFIDNYGPPSIGNAGPFAVLQILLDLRALDLSKKLYSFLLYRRGRADQVLYNFTRILNQRGMHRMAMTIVNEFEQQFPAISADSQSFRLSKLAALGYLEHFEDLLIYFNKREDNAIEEYIVAMQTLAKAGQYEAVQMLFNQVLSSDLKPNVEVFAVYMESRLKVGDLLGAFDIFELVGEHNLQPPATMFNMFVMACREANDVDLMFQAFGFMRSSGTVRPNKFILTSMMSLYSNRGEVQQTEEFLKYFKYYKIKPDLAVYRVLANGYARGCRLSEYSSKIDNLLQIVKQSDVAPDSSFFAIVIMGYIRLSDTRGISRTLQDMTAMNVLVNEEIFCLLINYFGSVHELELAERVYTQLTLSEVPTNAYHYTALMFAYIRANQPEKVVRVSNDMAKHKVKPTYLTTYAVLLSSAMTSPRTTARHYLRLLKQAIPKMPKIDMTMRKFTQRTLVPSYMFTEILKIRMKIESSTSVLVRENGQTWLDQNKFAQTIKSTRSRTGKKTESVLEAFSEPVAKVENEDATLTAKEVLDFYKSTNEPRGFDDVAQMDFEFESYLFQAALQTKEYDLIFDRWSQIRATLESDFKVFNPNLNLPAQKIPRQFGGWVSNILSSYIYAIIQTSRDVDVESVFMAMMDKYRLPFTNQLFNAMLVAQIKRGKSFDCIASHKKQFESTTRDLVTYIFADSRRLEEYRANPKLFILNWADRQGSRVRYYPDSACIEFMSTEVAEVMRAIGLDVLLQNPEFWGLQKYCELLKYSASLVRLLEARDVLPESTVYKEIPNGDYQSRLEYILRLVIQATGQSPPKPGTSVSQLMKHLSSSNNSCAILLAKGPISGFEAVVRNLKKNSISVRDLDLRIVIHKLAFPPNERPIFDPDLIN
ncbi:uncharacterized protein V1516DRAFT_670090 [Lipomyces oligophaga]|uniref:uncharacterized protein n=1 Tax=Lipomyces oligophaga TaxID=45792 RepID=UPI0034CE82C3